MILAPVAAVQCNGYQGAGRSALMGFGDRAWSLYNALMARENRTEHCGFSCPHSDFPPPETAGLCRTMAAVYCKKLKKLVPKNAPCQWRRRSKNA